MALKEKIGSDASSDLQETEMTLLSFFLLGAKSLIEDSQTWKLHELIDWEAVCYKLNGLYRWEQTLGGGPKPYAPLSMFKLILLGH